MGVLQDPVGLPGRLRPALVETRLKGLFFGARGQRLCAFRHDDPAGGGGGGRSEIAMS